MFDPNDPLAYEKYLQSIQENPWHPPMATDDMPQGDVESLQESPRNIAEVSKPIPQVQAPIPTVRDVIAQKYGYPQNLGNDALAEAQDLAGKKRMYAGIGEGASDIGRAIAGAKSPSDAKFYEGLSQQADIPVNNILQQRKAIQDEMAFKEQQAMQDPNSIQSQVFQKMAGLGLGGKVDMSGLPISQSKNIAPFFSAYESAEARKAAAQQRSDTQKTLAGTLNDYRNRRLGLMEGNQAFSLGKEFNHDKVMNTASTQEAQIDKALGRLADIKSGRVKFTQATKSEIEKDIANIISGGNASSLGQVSRIEFEPVIARMNNFMSKWEGKQRDLEIPEYQKQLEDTLTGLKSDISNIKARRSQELGSRLGGAFVNNPTAQGVLQSNITAPQEGLVGQKSQDPKINAYATQHNLPYEQAAAILKSRGYNGQ